MKSAFRFDFIFRIARRFFRQSGQADRCNHQGRAEQLKRCECLPEHKGAEDNGDDWHKIDEDGHRENRDAPQGIHIGEVGRGGDQYSQKQEINDDLSGKKAEIRREGEGERQCNSRDAGREVGGDIQPCITAVKRLGLIII